MSTIQIENAEDSEDQSSVDGVLPARSMRDLEAPGSPAGLMRTPGSPNEWGSRLISELESSEEEYMEEDQMPHVRVDGVLKSISQVGSEMVANRDELNALLAAQVLVRNLRYRAQVLSTEHHIQDLKTSLREGWRLEKVSKTEKVILDDINFYIEPKMFTLVLGAPGSGRTTLLNILANRTGRAEMDGHIYFDGLPIDPEMHHRKVAYVWSADNIHIPSLTVEETFRIALKLQVDLDFMRDRVRLGPEISRIEELLPVYRDVITQTLRLSHRKDTLVGDDLLRGLSGGEKRRLTVGIELLKFPQLLIADEFTTGLDSEMCVELGHFLRYMALRRIPVIASALQPPLGLYESFTHVLLLHQGRIAYFGKRKKILPYFARLGFHKPPGVNPADFLPDMLEHPSKYLPSTSHAVDFAGLWRGSPEAAQVLARLDRLIAVCHQQHPDQHAGPSGSQILDTQTTTNIPSGRDYQNPTFPPKTARFTSSFSTQYIWLVWRNAHSLMHVPAPVIGKVILSVVFGLFFGTVFLRLGYTQSDLSLRQSLCFNIATVICFKGTEASAIEFGERTVVNWQRNMKYYGILPYLLSGITTQIPVVLLDISVLATLAYWMGGLHASAEAFIYLILVSFSLTLVIYAVVRLIAVLSRSFEIAQQFVPLTIIVMLVFGGFYILPGSIPDYLIWAYWISPFQWAYVGLVTNELQGTAFTCDPDQLLPPLALLPPGGVQTCPFPTGDAYLEAQGFPQTDGWKWICLAVLLFQVLFFNVLCYMAFRFPIRKPSRFRQPRLPDLVSTINQSDLPSNEKLPDLPAEGVWLQFSDISYSVELGRGPCGAKDELQLLNHITGYAAPGMMVALMGSSGAGKTTLLDVISNRKTGGRISGQILFNGAEASDYLHRFAGYCEQQNLHVTSSTVREAVEFSALLRLDSRFTRPEKLLFAKQILTDLHLLDVAGLLISELSLSVLKRFTLAIELASNCPLLFLDEPTSGLDSVSALDVMQAIRRQADRGRTIVCTIHQPSAQVFSFFTHLLLLKKGGRMVYFGETSLMADYFSRTGGRLLREGENLADFGLSCLDAPEGSPDPADIWLQQPEWQRVCQTVEAGINPTTLPFQSNPSLAVAKVADYDTYLASSFGQQIKMLSIRHSHTFWRDPFVIRVKFIKQVLFGLLIGALFWQFGDAAGGDTHDQTSVRLRSAVFFITLQLSSLNAFDQIPALITPRAAYYRERSSGTFSAMAYAITVVIGEMFPVLITTLAFVIPVYWMTGMKVDAGNFFTYFLFTYLAGLTALSFAQFIAIMAPNTQIASFLAGLPSIVFNILAGFLIPKPDIPNHWIWGYYISYVNYALQALTINEFSGLLFTCPDNRGAVPFTYVNSSQVDYFCPVTSGEQVLDSLGVIPTLQWPIVGILSGFLGCFAFLSFIGLRFVNHMTR